MTAVHKRKSPISTRWNAHDEQLLLEASEVAGVSRHRLIRVATISLARSVLDTAHKPSGAA